MAITEAANWTGTGTGITSLALSTATGTHTGPGNVGDLIIVELEAQGTSSIAVFPTSISDTNSKITWQGSATITSTDSSTPSATQLWWGVVASTGATTVDLNGTSGAWSTGANRISVIEFAAGAGYTWSVDGSQAVATNNGTDSASTPGPSLTPAGSGELAFYAWGGSLTHMTAGSTSGYTYVNPGSSTHVWYAYNLSVSAATQPTMSNTGTNVTAWCALGVLLIATPGVPAASSGLLEFF